MDNQICQEQTKKNITDLNTYYDLNNQINFLLREKQRLIIQNLRYEQQSNYFIAQSKKIKVQILQLENKIKCLQQNLSDEKSLNAKLKKQLQQLQHRMSNSKGFNLFRRQSGKSVSSQKHIELYQQKHQLKQQIKIMKISISLYKKQSQQNIHQLKRKIQSYQLMIRQMEQIIIEKDNQIQRLIRQKDRQQNQLSQEQSSFSFCDVIQHPKIVNNKDKGQNSLRNSFQLQAKFQEWKLKSSEVKSSFVTIESKFSSLQQKSNAQEHLIQQLKKRIKNNQAECQSFRQQNLKLCKQLQQSNRNNNNNNFYRDKYQNSLNENEQIKYKFQKQTIQLNSYKNQNQILRKFNQNQNKQRHISENQQAKTQTKSNQQQNQIFISNLREQNVRSKYKQIQQLLDQNKRFAKQKQEMVSQIQGLLQQLEKKQQQCSFYLQKNKNSSELIQSLKNQLQDRVIRHKQTETLPIVSAKIKQINDEYQFQLQKASKELKKIQEQRNQLKLKLKMVQRQLRQKKQGTAQLTGQLQFQRNKSNMLDERIKLKEKQILQMLKQLSIQQGQIMNIHVKMKRQQNQLQLQIGILKGQLSQQKQQNGTKNTLINKLQIQIIKNKEKIQQIQQKSLQFQKHILQVKQQMKVYKQKNLCEQKKNQSQTLNYKKIIGELSEKNKQYIFTIQSLQKKNNLLQEQKQAQARQLKQLFQQKKQQVYSKLQGSVQNLNKKIQQMEKMYQQEISNLNQILNQKNLQIFLASKRLQQNLKDKEEVSKFQAILIEKQNKIKDLQRYQQIQYVRITQLTSKITEHQKIQSDLKLQIQSYLSDLAEKSEEKQFWNNKLNFLQEELASKNVNHTKQISNWQFKMTQQNQIVNSLKAQVQFNNIELINLRKQKAKQRQDFDQKNKYYEQEIRKFLILTQEYQQIIRWNVQKGKEQQITLNKNELKKTRLNRCLNIFNIFILPQKKSRQNEQNKRIVQNNYKISIPNFLKQKTYQHSSSKNISHQPICNQSNKLDQFQIFEAKLLKKAQSHRVRGPKINQEIAYYQKYLEDSKPTRQFTIMEPNNLALSTKFQKLKKFDTKQLDSKIKNIKNANDLLKKK